MKKKFCITRNLTNKTKIYYTGKTIKGKPGATIKREEAKIYKSKKEANSDLNGLCLKMRIQRTNKYYD